MAFRVSTRRPISSGVPGWGKRWCRLSSPIECAWSTTSSMAPSTRRVSISPARPTAASKASAMAPNSTVAAASTWLVSSSEPATCTARPAPDAGTGIETMRSGSSPNLGRVSKTVSPAARRASRAGGAGSCAASRLRLRASTRPSPSMICTRRSSRISDGGARPGATSCTCTGWRGAAGSMAISVSPSASRAASSWPCTARDRPQ